MFLKTWQFYFYNVQYTVIMIVVSGVVEDLSTTGVAANLFFPLGGGYLSLHPFL